MSAGQGSAPDLVPAGLPALRLLEDQAEAFVRAAKASATLRAYRSDWDHFAGWSESTRFVRFPRARKPLPCISPPWRPRIGLRR
jgi:hypothetical protein